MTVINTNYCTIDEAWGDLTGSKSKKDPPRRKKPPHDPICELYEAKANTSFNETDLVRFANEYYDKFDKAKYQRNMRTQSMAFENVEREPTPKSLVIKNNQSNYEATSPKKSPNKTLFEKQFEIKLPPLYDGGECPVINNDTTNRVNEEWNSYQPMGTIQEFHTTHDKYVSSETKLDDEYSDDDVDEEMMDIPYQKRKPTRGERPRCRQESRAYAETERRGYFDDYEESLPLHAMKKQYNNIHMLDLILYVVSGIILIFLMEQFVRIGINLQA